MANQCGLNILLMLQDNLPGNQSTLNIALRVVCVPLCQSRYTAARGHFLQTWTRCVVYQYQDCCYGSHWLDVPCEERIPTLVLVCKRQIRTDHQEGGGFTVVTIDKLYSPEKQTFGTHRVVEPYCKNSKSTKFLQYLCNNQVVSTSSFPNIDFITNDIKSIANIQCGGDKSSLSVCLDFVNHSAQMSMDTGSVTFKQEQLTDSEQQCPPNSIMFVNTCVMLAINSTDIIQPAISTCSHFTLSLINLLQMFGIARIASSNVDDTLSVCTLSKKVTHFPNKLLIKTSPLIRVMHQQCTNNYFVCKDLTCVLYSYVHNGKADCLDGSDETGFANVCWLNWQNAALKKTI